MLRSTYWLSLTQIPGALHKRAQLEAVELSSRADNKALSYRFSFQKHVWIIIQSLINPTASRAVISHETYGKGPQHKVLVLLDLIWVIYSQTRGETMPLNLHWKWMERTNCIGLGISVTFIHITEESPTPAFISGVGTIPGNQGKYLNLCICITYTI